MSTTTELLLEETTGRGLDAEVWDTTHEIEELICRDGRRERRSDVSVDATALTVRDGEVEGYAVQTPMAGDASLVDTALAVGRALSGTRAHAARPAWSSGPSVRTVVEPQPGLDDEAAERLTALSARFPGAEVELRARVDRYRVDLCHSGGEPLSSATGTCSVQVRVTVRDGQRTGFLADQLVGRSVSTVLDEAESGAVAELAGLATVLASPPAEELRYDHLLLDGRVTTTLLDLVVPSFQLDEVLEGRSQLADRIGERVAALGLSFVDDPGAADSPLPARWDDEGTECRRTVLVEDGVLRGFLSSWRTAAENGSASTGAGRRGPAGEMATIQPGFLALWPATDLGGAHRADATVLHVVQANGAHTSNSITGNFSIGANAVLVAPDGTRRNAGAITLAGNAFDLLGAVEGHDGRRRVSGSNRSFIASPGLWATGLVVGH